ncbi:hypothetical protein BD779DRAFT_1791056 [Infundibulicybe gibba]|nr:hypothetical protein BD779DRAFT_1791056 [Infundibulicybe gibba]
MRNPNVSAIPMTGLAFGFVFLNSAVVAEVQSNMLSWRVWTALNDGEYNVFTPYPRLPRSQPTCRSKAPQLVPGPPAPALVVLVQSPRESWH